MNQASELSAEMQQLISSFAKEMKSTLTEEQMKSQIKIALLENNVIINQAMDRSIEKIAESVDSKTNVFIEQIKEISKANGALENRVDSIELKIDGIGGKMIGIGAACTTLGGLVVFLINMLTS